MRSRIVRALPMACAFGAFMAWRGSAAVLGELARGTLRLPDLGVVLVTFGVCTGLALPLIASNLDKPNAGPLDMSPWSGWLLAGLLVVFVGTTLWVYPQPHAIRDGIVASVAFIGVFWAVYRIARANGWTRS